MDKKQTEQRDLTLAAMHEAAHVVLARRFGLMANAWLIPNPEGGKDSSYWVGKTIIQRGNGSTIAALAGTIAELRALDPDEPDADEMEGYIRDAVTGGEMSDTDLMLAGGAELITDKDVREAVRLVYELWGAR